MVHAFADHSKARGLFGTDAEVPLRKGLAQMAAWAKRVGARQSKEFDAIEVTKGLPSVWLEPSGSRNG